ncbi:PrsW family intramembrane metalloprotease [Bacillus sp. FJAT-49732]|uniref:PrsW family intramembrane metalloprotease n=1 Tax=Lederbergia citrisecunda TaxID=2833583 RepID=A0A942YNX8_9BACI|nr:PrsW family glutamic-type intramembrane protease [Lederbergia citrisecunda]MBS4202190.1 PrsW family intramembrane metalloprotease [Lederbergia citrisecunda]
MTSRIEKIRLNIRGIFESTHQTLKEWTQKHPSVVFIYTIFSWVSLIIFVLSLFFMEDSRKIFVQYFWSFYVILQFWLLCRSKTLSWKQYTYFFLATGWLIVPLNSFIVLAITWVFGGQASNVWSQAFLTPIAEEVLKLIPLAVYLFLSRRASALSLSDFALIGAASGAGFQFVEEVTRRLISGSHYGVTLLGGKVLHWDLFTLFPGYFEESIFPTQMTSGHALLTAMVTLGIGIAIRYKQKFMNYFYIFPGFLLFMAVYDHILWNASYQAPKLLQSIHKILGSGYAAKPLFLLMLTAALLIDYWELNRVREKIPLLEYEKIINPFTELWNLIVALLKDRQRFGYLLFFYRERRELAFTFIHGNAEAKDRIPLLKTNVQKYYGVLTIIAITVLVALVIGGWESIYSNYETCFACLFDSLQNWWDRLSGWEKGIIIAGAFALSVPFLGIWSAIGAVSMGMGVVASGHQISDILRNPKKLLTPEYAAAAIFTLGLRRFPFGKIVSAKVLKTAKGFTRHEFTTKGGLTYRTTHGSMGELRSVFAKISHLKKGTATNDASRRYARSLGKQTDDAGHGIGNNLGGLGSRFSGNIFPQNLSINRGKFAQFEGMIADEVQAGKTVFVRVVPKYASGSTRPYEVVYNVRIDGQTITRVFQNP